MSLLIFWTLIPPVISTLNVPPRIKMPELIWIFIFFLIFIILNFPIKFFDYGDKKLLGEAILCGLKIDHPLSSTPILDHYPPDNKHPFVLMVSDLLVTFNHPSSPESREGWTHSLIDLSSLRQLNKLSYFA